jgi:hypothetical protein
MIAKPSDADGEVFPPALEASTLQYRLETGNIAKQGGQRGSLTRCAQKLGLYQSHLLASHPDAEIIETSKQDLKQDIDLFKLELLKLILLQKNLRTQVALNEEMIEDRQAEIDQSSEEVKAGQSEANLAQETKRCFEEYEAVAKMTNEMYPRSTRELKDKLMTVRKQIEELKKEDAATAHILKVRESQFQLLIMYMTDLKRSLNDADEQEKLLDLAGQVGGDKGVNDGDSSQDASKPDERDVDEEEDGLYGDV